MKKIKFLPGQPLHALGYILVLVVLALPVKNGTAIDQITPPGSPSVSPIGSRTGSPMGEPALIRIEVESQADLKGLRDIGFQIYTHLFDTHGTAYVLALADPLKQEDLIHRGYDLRVLDSDAGEETYYLLYGDPDLLNQVASYASILEVEGSQMLVRSTPARVENLGALGLRIQALDLHPIVLPRLSETESISYPILPDPTIQEMLDQVDSDTLSTYVGNLSGEWPVIIDSEPYTITTRYTIAITPTQKATQFAYEHFQSLGLSVSYFDFIYGDQERNVIAEQTGQTHPDEIFLITAHLDSISGDPFNYAPGADDNASGSTAVMVAADILSQYDFDRTLRYVLFTGEEQGLHGSRAYAADLFSQGEDIAGVLNLDMIAYDSDEYPILDLHARSALPDSITIANLFSQVVTTYSLDLTPEIMVDDRLGDYSDNKSFWAYGYPAILAIEDYNDFTPYYHTTSDRLNTLNISYFTEFVKAALGTFAHIEGTYNPPVHLIFMPLVITAGP